MSTCAAQKYLKLNDELAGANAYHRSRRDGEIGKSLPSLAKVSVSWATGSHLISFGGTRLLPRRNPAGFVADPPPVAAWIRQATKFQAAEFVGCVAVDKTPTASRPEGPNNVVRAASMSVWSAYVSQCFPPHGTGRSTGTL